MDEIRVAARRALYAILDPAVFVITIAGYIVVLLALAGVEIPVKLIFFVVLLAFLSFVLGRVRNKHEWQERVAELRGLRELVTSMGMPDSEIPNQIFDQAESVARWGAEPGSLFEVRIKRVHKGDIGKQRVQLADGSTTSYYSFEIDPSSIALQRDRAGKLEVLLEAAQQALNGTKKEIRKQFGLRRRVSV